MRAIRTGIPVENNGAIAYSNSHEVAFLFAVPADGKGWILLVVVVLAAGLLQARWVKAQLDPGGETSEDESDSLVSLVRYTADQPLYLDYRQPPHLLTPYMPLFYVIPGTVARWLQCDKLGTIVVGRCYVYLCWLGIGWLIYWLARQAGA